MIKLITDFYNELDTFNLILFWVVIIVIILLLTFSIIMINRNKRLRQIIIDKGIEIDSDEKDVPIVKNDNNVTIKENTTINNYHTIPITSNKTEEIIKKEIIKETPTPPTQEHTENIIVKKEENISRELAEKIAPKNINISNIERINKSRVIDNTEKHETIKTEEPKEFIPTEYVHEYKTTETNKRIPYEKNLIKKYSLNQTSPIGLSNRTIPDKEGERARDLYQSLNEKIVKKEEPPVREIETQRSLQEKYSELKRTTYEKQQEEDAIISFKELMQKKDQLKMVDEEEAVISIEELIKKEKEKLYNITKDEQNEKFIEELKKFRSDL